jgi:hypothetical protein
MSGRLMPVLALFAGLALCGGNIARAEAPTATAPAIVVSAANGGARIAIVADAQHVDIQAGTVHLIGDSRGDKRYYHRDGKAFVEVKSDAGGFKVRTPDSKLLWKVKLATDKIKVSDNEENANAWSIKTDYADKAKVLDPAGKEVGEVKYAARSGKIKLKDAAGAEQYIVDGGKQSAAYGALLMNGVPEEYRSVIVAELLAKGR